MAVVLSYIPAAIQLSHLVAGIDPLNEQPYLLADLTEADLNQFNTRVSSVYLLLRGY